MNTEKNISNKIDSVRPSLTENERLSVWKEVSAKLPSGQPVVSPFSVKNVLHKIMNPMIILLVLLLGGGGTALASNSARPGDILFPIDRSIENLQLKLASSEEEKTQLTKKFTEERLQELREIIDEEVSISPSNADDAASASTVSASTTLSESLEIEARIFTDTTVVKIEFNGKKFYFETTAKDEEGIVLAVKDMFPVLTNENITNALTLDIEGRVSRPKDRGVVSLSQSGEKRINVALEALFGFIDETSADEASRNELVGMLSDEVTGVVETSFAKRERDSVRVGSNDGRVDIRIDDNGDSRVDVRSGDSRVRVEERSGEVKVRTAEAKKREVKTENTTSTNIDPVFQAKVNVSIEATIFIDTTVIEMEINGYEIYFETVADTRDEIIDAIIEQFPSLSADQIEENLKVKEKNRFSDLKDVGLDDDSEEVLDRNYEHDDDEYEEEHEDEYEEEHEDEREHEYEEDDEHEEGHEEREHHEEDEEDDD